MFMRRSKELILAAVFAATLSPGVSFGTARVQAEKPPIQSKRDGEPGGLAINQRLGTALPT
jgi:hypothetical protein